MQDPQHAGLLDRFSAALGEAASWLTLLMVVITVVVVVLRYLFDLGFIWVQESITWMHGVVFMLGAAYTLREEEHVRVDVFYRGMNPRQRAWVDIVGVVLFLFPLCAFLAWNSVDFVLQSWRIGEESREPGGLPFPFLPLLKTVILLMPVTVALQGVSLCVRSIDRLRER